MSFDQVWRELREAATALDPDSVLVTPVSERAFTVRSTTDDRVVVGFSEGDEERTLWRSGFEVLYERLAVDGESLALSELASGVEPYAAVLSLGSEFAVDDGALLADGGGTAGASPFVRAEWEARTTPERIHDDALLLAESLERYDVEDLASVDAADLVNLYVLLSDVQRETDRLRSAAGDVLLDRVGPEGRLHGQFGTVTRTVRSRRRLKPTDDVLDALDAAGIPEGWVLGVDADKLDVVLSVTNLEEADVYDVDEQVYVQKTSVEEAEKHSRLEGLQSRLAAIEDEAAASELYDEIAVLERRIDEVLAAG